MEYYVKSVISIIESNYHKLTSAEKTVADFFIHNNQNTDFSSNPIWISLNDRLLHQEVCYLLS